jgi:hypothetical protein
MTASSMNCTRRRHTAVSRVRYRARMRWMAVWTRAVIVPATRRAGALWAGCGIVGAVIFGPTAMRPHDVTALALHVVPIGVMLAVTWLLLFLPTARVVVRADAAAYLGTLPHLRAAPVGTAAIALVVLQLPWLVLWWWGDGARGVLIVLGWTCAIALVAMWRAPRLRPRWPRWRSVTRAFVGVYMRALRRRAGDALMRAAGLALFAGVAGALIVRNNQLAGFPAATLAAAAISAALVPGWAGALLPLVDAHRASAWLAATSGLSSFTRARVLAACVAAVYALAATIACVAAAFLLPDARTFAALVGVTLPTTLGSSLVATRLLLWAERAPTATAPRAIVGAILASAAAILTLGLLGAAGAIAMVAVGLLAIATVSP